MGKDDAKLTGKRAGEEEKLFFLASIVESSDDAIIGITLDGIILNWNLGAQEIFDYSIDEVIGKPISILVPPDRPDEIFQLLKRAGQGESIKNFETVRVRKDGKRIDISQTVSPVKDTAGRIIAISTIARDITERKREELDIQEARNYAENIVETVREPLLVLDAQMRVKTANSSFYRTFKVSPEDTLNKIIYDLGNRQWNIPRLRELLEEIIPRNNQFQDFEVEHEFPSIGRRIMLLNARQIYRKDIGTQMILLAIEDITERKRMEEELRRRTEDLARSNAELEQFAYIASHDLQEPLRMISGFTQLLARRYKGKMDKDADEFIAYVVDGAARMQRMIEDLLAYSRVGTRGKPFEPINLEDVFNQAVTNLKAAIEENKAVITHDPLPTVMADATQLIQLFQNLIANSIKFRKKEEPPRIHISARRKGNEWLFSVQDNGIGIASEFMEHLFQLFQRTHPAGEYPGTGIGLATCKKIVERHGGRIWAESEPGKGSTFYFTIPVRGER